MKKLLTITLALVMIASAFVIPTSAYVSYSSAAKSLTKIKDGDLIYYEDFDLADLAYDTNAADNVTGNKAITDALGWRIANKADGALNDHTAMFSIVGGRLYFNNNRSDEEADGDSKDSYCYILEDSEMWEIIGYGKYTIQYDLEYTQDFTDSKDRYVTLIWNYDGTDSYNSVHIRTRGTGNNQPRYQGSWYHYDDTVEGLMRANTSTTGESIISKLTNGQIEYEANVMGLQNINFTIRMVCDDEKHGPVTYVRNNNLEGAGFVQITQEDAGTGGAPYWCNEGLMPGFALALKTTPKVRGYLDNIYVYAGLGEAPTDKVTNYKALEMPAASEIRNASSKEFGGVVYLGAQSKIADGKMDVRLIGGIESKKYNKVGFDLKITGMDNAPTNLESNGCYQRIYQVPAGATEAESYTSYDARYLYAETITGMPATGTVTIELTAYSIDFDGQKTIADTIVVTYTDGKLVSQTYKS